MAALFKAVRTLPNDIANGIAIMQGRDVKLQGRVYPTPNYNGPRVAHTRYYIRAY